MPSSVRSQFYCNESHRVAYLLLHKCACSSIIYHLAQLEARFVEDPLRDPKRYFDLVTPDEDQLGDYLTFTFVRDPYDRFLSFYAERIRGSGRVETLDHYAAHGVRADMPFDECVDAITAIRDQGQLDAHAAPQASFVFRGRRSRVKFLGRLETIATDMGWVHRACGIENELPHINPSRRPGLEHLYTAANRRKIFEYYLEDFLAFGYPSRLDAEIEDPGAGIHLRELLVDLYRCRREVQRLRAASSDPQAGSPKR